MDIIIITSVINITDKPLSYTNTRSIYSHEERFKQTMETINSIKQYYKDYYIILVEGTELSSLWEDIIINNVDYYYNISNTHYKKYIDSLSKGLGEVSILLAYLTSNHFIKNKDNINSISKLSGRYKLTNDFINIKDYLIDNKIIVYKNIQHNLINTTWFCFRIDEVNNFINILQNSFNNQKLVFGKYSIENYLYDNWIINNQYKHIDKIGIEGYVSVCGSKYTI